MDLTKGFGEIIQDYSLNNTQSESNTKGYTELTQEFVKDIDSKVISKGGYDPVQEYVMNNIKSTSLSKSNISGERKDEWGVTREEPLYVYPNWYELEDKNSKSKIKTDIQLTQEFVLYEPETEMTNRTNRFTPVQEFVLNNPDSFSLFNSDIEGGEKDEWSITRDNPLYVYPNSYELEEMSSRTSSDGFSELTQEYVVKPFTETKLVMDNIWTQEYVVSFETSQIIDSEINIVQEHVIEDLDGLIDNNGNVSVSQGFTLNNNTGVTKTDSTIGDISQDYNLTLNSISKDNTEIKINQDYSLNGESTIISEGVCVIHEKVILDNLYKITFNSVLKLE